MTIYANGGRAGSFNQEIKSLNIRYQGQAKIRGQQRFYFHDLQTNTNFYTTDLDQVRVALENHREAFYAAQAKEPNETDIPVPDHQS